MINFFENTVMAMQTGVGLSKILILASAGTVPTEFLTSILLFYFSYCFNFDFNLLISFSGYTGTVLLKKGKLSDILGELQSLVKGLEKSGEQADDSDALLA
ncbi:hypothetical protein ES288_D04G037800v1 [Gossypium darwinii]|uniref:Uncharacterized protein n=1 Tax=Gossypium darwinii TaxID=34276 RepID=A0A5D2CV93_GOSDA|nr:hypothetical protein ES288_D04G037800v1 [Gossypium darwinii]